MSAPFRVSTATRLVSPGASFSTRLLAWLALAAATTLLVRAEVLRADYPEGVRAYTDLVYRHVDGRRLRLDVFVPAGAIGEGARLRPAIVAIHGGGWRGGSKTDYGRDLARLARHGLVVVAVDYRLSRPGEPSWPGNLEDVREAVRWVRLHASDYTIDAERVAVMGASAGGHLALLLGSALAEGPSRVRAVIDFYGPTDLGTLYARRTLADESIGLLLGGPPEAFPSRYEAASPLRHVDDRTPPVLIVHGTDDPLVPLQQSRSLAEALGRAGVRHRLITVNDARHGFGLKAGDRDLVPDILAFLDGVWGEPPAGVMSRPPGRRSWSVVHPFTVSREKYKR